MQIARLPMRNVAFIALSLILVLLGLLQVLRLFGPNFGDRIVGALVLVVIVFAGIGSYRWWRRK